MAKTKKQTATDDAVQFDYTGFLTETVDAVAQRLNYDSDPIESATPMSTGMLTLDLLYGGGIRPGWYTHFGKEQSSKTTGALVIAANAIKEKVPLITFFDYEGCVTANTLIQVKGQNIKLKDLFDLSDYKNWTPNTWQDQTHVVDTLCNNKRGYKSAKARLFYKGIHPTQKIIFNTGHELECYNHKFFVYRNGYLAVVSQQDLQVGELVFVRKDYFEPMQEEWRPVVGEGKGIRRKFEVSNCGRVRSTGDKRLIKRKDSDSVFVRTIAPRLLTPRTLKDGHQSVFLCMDHRITQRLVHRLVARAFIGKAPRGLPLVCHYNDDPADNRVFNLHYSDDAGNNREKALHWRAPHSQNAILANSTSAFRDRIRDLYDVFTMKEIREMYPEASYHTVSKYWKTELCKDEFFGFSFDSIRSNYELASIVSIEDTEKEKPVFDIGLHNETDFLPHSIITNGIVTHNSSVNSMPYIQSILKTVGIDKTIAQVFGAKDHDSGKWITPPIIRFHVESVAEKFFDFLANVLRELPDKKMINGRWWLIYEDNKKNKARVGEFADPSMGKRYGPGLWVPAPDGELQALFIVDSYPAMNPASNDEEETDNSLALQARMFSKQLPRVKGRLMQKMVAVIGTNQLRDAPMVMYGPKENEPGGQALKFNADCRCKFTPRSSGQPLWPKNFDKETGWEIEPSVEFEKGRDSYRYIHLKTIKNKLSVPNRVGWIRIWTNDGEGSARGYDPVFDTIYYLYVTGQLVGRGRKSMKLKLSKTDIEPSVTWIDLKRWILGDRATKVEMCEKFGYKQKFCLRKFCFNQLKKGIGEKLYIEHTQSSSAEDDSEE